MRGAELIRKLLAFSRKEQVTLAPLDLAQVVEDMARTNRSVAALPAGPSTATGTTMSMTSPGGLGKAHLHRQGIKSAGEGSPVLLRRQTTHDRQHDEGARKHRTCGMSHGSRGGGDRVAVDPHPSTPVQRASVGMGAISAGDAWPPACTSSRRAMVSSRSPARAFACADRSGVRWNVKRGCAARPVPALPTRRSPSARGLL